MLFNNVRATAIVDLLFTLSIHIIVTLRQTASRSFSNLNLGGNEPVTRIYFFPLLNLPPTPFIAS